MTIGQPNFRFEKFDLYIPDGILKVRLDSPFNQLGRQVALQISCRIPSFALGTVQKLSNHRVIVFEPTSELTLGVGPQAEVEQSVGVEKVVDI